MICENFKIKTLIYGREPRILKKENSLLPFEEVTAKCLDNFRDNKNL